jgi:hypothetical protein
VGNNGETLVADSSTSTGLRYQAPYAQQPVLNSAFQIWQRGTSITPTVNGGAYSADRWFVTRAANLSVTASRQLTSDTTNLPNIQYCARVQRTASTTTTTDVQFGQMFETINSIPFAGKTVVLSGYIRKGANFSATSDALIMQVITGTGTDQNQMDGGYTGGAASVTGSVTLTSTWQRFSVTGTIPTNTTEITTKFLYAPTGTAGANDYFEVTGVQLEVGSVATPFHTYAATIQGELAACQRYYWRAGGTTAYELAGQGTGQSTTVTGSQIPLPSTMRIIPTAVDYATLAVQPYGTGTITSVSSVALDSVSGKNLVTVAATVASGLTQGQVYRLFTNNSTSGYIGLSAEL